MNGIRLGFGELTTVELGGVTGQLPVTPLRYKGSAHLITVAPTRSGKGRDVLVPALLDYEGSCIVIDPKGQLAAITKAERERRGQRVIVLNPFNILPDELGPTALYNPMSGLDPQSPGFGADCDSIADAIVTRDDRGESSHWSDSARQLISGIMMQLACHGREDQKNLTWVRKLVSGPTSVLRAFVAAALATGDSFIEARLGRFENLTDESRELLGIISTANTQTGFISNKAITDNLSGSDFRFRDLKRKPSTVYLVLPAKYLDTCGKWFRLVVASALADLWTEEKGAVPVLAILDEFAQLGHLQAIQNAMGMAAGFGLQLWPILQDLTQLKDLYKDRWETFLANAGVQQFFAPRENTTAEYVSTLCGEKTVKDESSSRGSSENAPNGLGLSRSVGKSENTTISNKQRRVFLPHEVRQLPDNEFLMFVEGVPNVIRGYRMPYYHASGCIGRFSPDPYHREAEKTSLTLVDVGKEVVKDWPGPGTMDLVVIDVIEPVALSLSAWKTHLREEIGADGAIGIAFKRYELTYLPTNFRVDVMVVSSDPKQLNPMTDCVGMMIQSDNPRAAALGKEAIVFQLHSMGAWPHPVTDVPVSVLDELRLGDASNAWLFGLTPEDKMVVNPDAWTKKTSFDDGKLHSYDMTHKATAIVVAIALRGNANQPDTINPYTDCAASFQKPGAISRALFRLRGGRIPADDTIRRVCREAIAALLHSIGAWPPEEAKKRRRENADLRSVAAETLVFMERFPGMANQHQIESTRKLLAHLNAGNLFPEAGAIAMELRNGITDIQKLIKRSREEHSELRVVVVKFLTLLESAGPDATEAIESARSFLNELDAGKVPPDATATTRMFQEMIADFEKRRDNADLRSVATEGLALLETFPGMANNANIEMTRTVLAHLDAGNLFPEAKAIAVEVRRGLNDIQELIKTSLPENTELRGAVEKYLLRLKSTSPDATEEIQTVSGLLTELNAGKTLADTPHATQSFRSLLMELENRRENDKSSGASAA